MSIETTKPIKSLAALQSISEVTKDSGNKSCAITAFGQAPEFSAHVELSKTATSLSTSGSDDIDADKISKIKEALERGELHLDAGKIADALLTNSIEQNR